MHKPEQEAETPASWLEVSIELDSELTEAVAEAMARYCTNGVVVENGVEYDDAEEVGHATPPYRVYGYLPFDDKLEETRQRLAEALWYLGRIQPLPEPQFRVIQNQDWMAAWKKHYRPILIGSRMVILPAWVEQVPEGRIPVRIDPSMAFGTGAHPTTQLCLELVEKYVQPGQPVLDIGCGSGILAVGALKLGASRGIGVDIDPESIRSATENAELNGVSELFEVHKGSVSEVLEGQYGIKQAPLVLANILAPIILRLLGQGLGDLVSDGGVLALSGILDRQADEVEAAVRALGFTLLEKTQIADWVAFAFRKG